MNMKKVLIVIDMQNDFITGSLGSEEAKKIVPNVVKKIKEYYDAGEDVFYTRDTHFNDYLETLEGQKLPIKHCIFNTNGYEICDEIKNIESNKYRMENIYNKLTFGYDGWRFILGHTDEAGEFSCDYESIEIVGLDSDVCVASNCLILRALFPNTKITVDAQCCAGTTPEKHRAALDVMESCQIEIINRREQ